MNTERRDVRKSLSLKIINLINNGVTIEWLK